MLSDVLYELKSVPHERLRGYGWKIAEEMRSSEGAKKENWDGEEEDEREEESGGHRC